VTGRIKDLLTPPLRRTPAPAAPTPAGLQRAPTAPARPVDTQQFAPSVTAAGLNPAVSAERQKATFERVFKLGKLLVSQGKVPVIVIDHRLTAMDDRPIIKAGLQDLARRNNVTELLDVDAALANGTLKSLPGYTEQASDHWRAQHPELVAKYPQVFGGEGSRLNIGFMSHSPREANATAGLAELAQRWAVETGGKGQIVFAGSGTGTLADFVNVYSRPKAQGGAGLENPDVRFGAPSPSAAATARAQALVQTYNQQHQDEEPVRLDQDSAGKAGWIETIEGEQGPNGEEKVVAAFIDDRAHNRIGAEGAAKLGQNLIAIKADAPGLSFSQNDDANENQISTFSPNPQ